jgi:hypothetical protein
MAQGFGVWRVVSQNPEHFETHAELFRKRWIKDVSKHHAAHVSFGAQFMGVATVARNPCARHER